MYEITTICVNGQRLIGTCQTSEALAEILAKASAEPFIFRTEVVDLDEILEPDDQEEDDYNPDGPTMDWGRFEDHYRTEGGR